MSGKVIEIIGAVGPGAEQTLSDNGRLRGMFSNADEVQGDSEPPQSANSCSACINLLIHLGKLGIWGTP